MANLSKQTDTNPSDMNIRANNANTGDTDSAYVASYIENANKEKNQASFLEIPSEPSSPAFTKQ